MLAFLSFTLPGQVDSAKGERPARLASVRARRRRPRKPLRTVSVPVRSALTDNSAIRALSGLLLFFLAFLLVYLIGFFNLETDQELAQWAKGMVKFLLHFLFLVARQVRRRQHAPRERRLVEDRHP